MQHYTPGKQNREAIVLAAKQLFWEKGFEATTIKEITERAGIRRTLFFYYYPSKNDLAMEIYNSFNQQMENMLLDEIVMRRLHLNAALYRGLFVTLNLRTALVYPELTRFSAEVDNGILQMRSDFVRDKYEKLILEGTRDTEDTKLELIMIQNLGINTLLFQLCSQGLLNEDIDTLVRFKIETMFKSVFNDETYIRSLMEQVFELEKDFLFTVDSEFNLTLSRPEMID